MKPHWKATAEQGDSSVMEVPAAQSPSTPTKEISRQVSEDRALGDVSRAQLAPNPVATVYLRISLSSVSFVPRAQEHLEADTSESTSVEALAEEQRAFIREVGGDAAAGVYVESPD